MTGALAALLLAGSAASVSTPLLQVYFFNVGEGDAALVVSPTGKTALIDAGPASSATELRKRLERLLHAPLDYALLTHAHLDHLGGMTEALTARGARQFIDSGVDDPSPARRDLEAYLRNRGIPARAASLGERLDLGGGAALTFLAPLQPLMHGARSDIHANSLVLRLDYDNVRILFAGDIESETESRLVSFYGAGGLRAHVLKVARHGASTSSTASFLKEVQPSYAVVSVGAGNGLDFPSGDALARLREAGARVLRTDVDGDLLLTSDGTELTLGPAPFPSAAPEPKQVDRERVEKVVASRRPNLFHTLDCPTGRKLKGANRLVFPSRDAALKAGKSPARDCNP